MDEAAATRMPPSEQERLGYYYGIPSIPKLLARTSSEAWDPRMGMGWPASKGLKNVGSHKIVEKYDTEMITLLIEALGSLSWHSIDIVRIGYEDDLKPGQKWPVILWISIEPNSVQWESALPRAFECKKVLENSGIDDVHCEMRECKLNQYVGPALKPLDIETAHEAKDLWHTTTLGQCLASARTPHCEGTLGLYLRSKRNGDYFALTCRHLFWSSETVEIGDYKRKNTSQPKIKMLQPGSTTIESEMKDVKAGLDYWVKPDECYQNEMGEAFYRSALKRQKHLKDFQEPTDRAIGHLYASPSLSTHEKLKWTRDWALVKLDMAKYAATPKNTMYIGANGLRTEPESLVILNPDMIKHLKPFYNKAIELQGFIPIKEMKKSPMKDKNGDPFLLVAKRGRSTGLTWGRANEIESIVRWYGNAVPSKEWCILGLENQAFSRRGDSGSAIFDIRGRVGGILTGGSGQTERTDVTYATPFQWLQSDIEEFLGEEVDFP